jgi:tRNA-modifying protein YgfZ
MTENTGDREETMGEAAGYRAAIETAAVFDSSRRGKIAVAGRDRRTYLHAMLTNDIAPLEAGSGCYAAYLTQQGRMIADMRVLELGDMVLLDLDESAAPTVLQKLDQFVFTEDVQLGDLGAAFARLSVAGPAAGRIVAAALQGDGGPAEADLVAWPEFRNARAVFRGQMVLVAASRDLGMAGFDLYIEHAHRDALRSALLEVGAVPGGEEAAEILRIESGRPRFAAEMDADTIPLEAGIEERAISFTKGCYPGQEVVIRILHRGQGRVARKIAGLRVAGEAVPARGDAVHAGDRETGRVTSAAWSPRANGAVALAMLHRDFLEPGTPLSIRHGERELAATVAALPFVP